MASLRLYLDTRYTASDTLEAPIKIILHHRSQASHILTGIKVLPSQWDKLKCKVVRHPNAARINRLLQERIGAMSAIISRLVLDYNLRTMSAAELCSKIKQELNPEEAQPVVRDTKTVKVWFEKWIAHKAGRTRDLYEVTERRIIAWLGEVKYSKLHFEDINRDWLMSFDDFLASTAPSANARAIHMRNLRAVCNYAIDNDVTGNYPFRRFKSESTATRKRSLNVEVLRRIFAHTCAEEWQQRYLDAFKLSFLLIGINIVDLCALTEVRSGRIEYIRSKTKRRYDIKVEPEAMALIDKYRGAAHLLSFADNCANYRHFYNKMSSTLRIIAPQVGLKELTSYFARHSWATLASRIGIPHETIARALGHGGHSVTDIYIDYDMQKVDEANRKVLDYLFGH